MNIKRIILFAALILTACTKNELGKAGDSVKELKTDFYTMKITGDAGFGRFLQQGGASSTDELAEYIADYLSAGPFGKLKCSINPAGFACSALYVESPDGTGLAGRNFDWDDCKAMVIRSFPADGYASVSTANLDFLGFGDKYKPTGMINAFKATAAIYVPMDGINEKGLVVADLMAGDDELTDQKDPSKKNLTTTTAIRLLLNCAANVDEATALLGQYNIHSDIGSAHHFFIADAGGKSVAVEWTGGEMVVTPTVVLNNHYLCDAKKGIASSPESLKHEAKLMELRDAAGGVMTNAALTDAMFSVLSLPDASYYGGTQWTIAYDIANRTATYHWRRDRSEWFSFCAAADITANGKD